MRYRAQDANGDYIFAGNSQFLVNSPACVAQAILTRLKLYVGEWFLDNRVGLDKSKILGYGTATTRDPEIQLRILQTEGVQALNSYASSVDPSTRTFTVSANVDTIYGSADIQASF